MKPHLYSQATSSDAKVSVTIFKAAGPRSPLTSTVASDTRKIAAHVISLPTKMLIGIFDICKLQWL